MRDPEMLLQNPFTAEEEAYLDELLRVARLRPRYKFCFQNAQRLVDAAHDLGVADGIPIEYGEGLADGGFGWTGHGVAVLNGKAVDVTWGSRNLAQVKRASRNLIEVRYFVVRLTQKEIAEVLLAENVHGTIAQRMEHEKWHLPPLVVK